MACSSSFFGGSLVLRPLGVAGPGESQPRQEVSRIRGASSGAHAAAGSSDPVVTRKGRKDTWRQRTRRGASSRCRAAAPEAAEAILTDGPLPVPSAPVEILPSPCLADPQLPTLAGATTKTAVLDVAAAPVPAALASAHPCSPSWASLAQNPEALFSPDAGTDKGGSAGAGSTPGTGDNILLPLPLAQDASGDVALLPRHALEGDLASPLRALESQDLLSLSSSGVLEIPVSGSGAAAHDIPETEASGDVGSVGPMTEGFPVVRVELDMAVATELSGSGFSLPLEAQGPVFPALTPLPSAVGVAEAEAALALGLEAARLASRQGLAPDLGGREIPRTEWRPASLAAEPSVADAGSVLGSVGGLLPETEAEADGEAEAVPRGSLKETAAIAAGVAAAGEALLASQSAAPGEPVRVARGLDVLRWAQDAWGRSGAGPRVRAILGFAGPALGIWLCSPLMSLIDTAVVGNSSSLELAALGPGTIVVDNLSFLYMFLSTAAANLIATSMAEQKPREATAHLQRLLFVSLVCGVGMVLFSELCAGTLIAGLAGSNRSVIPAALRYAKIRGLAWPAVLVTSVAQSASLALQDSWSPLLCLGAASAINLFGDILLCRGMGLGIAGAAWATAVSQYAACGLMLLSLARDPRLSLGVQVPTAPELLGFMSLAGPIFLSLVAKVGFYTLVTFMATRLGTVSLATHQVVIGIFAVCAVCAEPLSQTAQAFLPRLCVGAQRNLKEAQALIQTLGVVALLLGVLEAVAAAFISLSAPGVFTSDPSIAAKMGSVVLPLCVSLLLNPVVLAAEGVLLANRDVAFLAAAMLGNLALCGSLLLAAGRMQLGLLGNWWIVVVFQVGRIVQACGRICSPHGIVAQAKLHAA